MQTLRQCRRCSFSLVALDRFRIDPDAAVSAVFGTTDGRGFLNFLFEGITSGDRNGAAVGLIALIFIIGGSFALVNETGAVERGLLRLVALSGGHPAWLLGSLTVAFSLGGAVFGSQAYVDEVTQKMMVWGQAPDPFACWLLERGLKTLHIRVERANANAMALASWCEAQPAFAAVHYPGLASHPDHALAAATMDGFGGMMSLELVGGAAAADRMVERLALVLHATSLGGVDSLICEPRFSSHAHMTSEERAALGIPDGFLRVSVGIEDVRDLIADFAQALA